MTWVVKFDAKPSYVTHMYLCADGLRALSCNYRNAAYWFPSLDAAREVAKAMRAAGYCDVKVFRLK